MSPKQLSIILSGLLSLIIIGTLTAFVLIHRTINTKIIRLQRLSGDVVLENEQINRLRNLEADYKKNEPLALKAQSVLPNQKQQSEVVAQISAIVKGNGMELSGLSFEQTKGLPDEKSQTIAGRVSGILTMPVRFDSTGSYQQLQGLLQSFERQQRYMRVSTLEIKRAESGNNIAFNMTLEVFLKP